MRVGLVFHKNPLAPPTSIDLIRLRAISQGLIHLGLEVEIIAPIATDSLLAETIPVRPLKVLNNKGYFHMLKTCYHPSIRLIDAYQGPVVSRLVRVVDEQWPERDQASRGELLACQELIRSRAAALVFNNQENLQRWRQIYGARIPAIIVPSGCPAHIPPPRKNPFSPSLPVLLFLGSLAAPRMLQMLNELAVRLQGRVELHFIGRNKAAMYGGSPDQKLHPLIVDHGEIQENEIWDYLRNAAIGLALATGPHPFDNDVSKILYYLRGGLPVISEEPILNNNLIRETGWGQIFRHGDLDDLEDKTNLILAGRLATKKEIVMEFMATHHSWDQRAETFRQFFQRWN